MVEEPRESVMFNTTIHNFAEMPDMPGSSDPIFFAVWQRRDGYSYIIFLDRRRGVGKEMRWFKHAMCNSIYCAALYPKP